MASWTLRGPPTLGDRIYDRSLGANELGFYWDSIFNGTADTLQTAVVETPANASKLLDWKNVSRAWISLKQRYPLLGAQISDVNGTHDDIRFVVVERRLGEVSPGELNFLEITSASKAQEVFHNIFHGSRHLSPDRLAQIYILTRLDLPSVFHITIHAAHCITDGMANATIISTFLHFLSSSGRGSFEPVPDLPSRLAIAIASEDLAVDYKYSIAKRRWWRAMGYVIFSNRAAKLKGGHSLPRRITSLTDHTPADPRITSLYFSPDMSARIIANCRKFNITFGNSYPVLGQVAMARVLHRKFIRGDIGHEEWEYRKREPMYTAGPLNLRPYLDKEWYEHGGASNVCLSIGYFDFTLPFMPLPQATNQNNTPTFSDFLTPKRFLLRSNMIKAQSIRLMKHPLMLETMLARTRSRIEARKTIALKWRKGQIDASGSPPVVEDTPVVNQGLNVPVLTHRGSSFGNSDLLVPLDYPLPSEGHRHDLKPVSHIQSTLTKLHCRPAELYLGAATSRRQLTLTVYWDGNVYGEDVVMEWLKEFRDATAWYLGRDEESKL